MIDAANYGFCEQFYTVEKSLEVLVSLGGEQRSVRIEALRGRDGSYSTKAYIKEELARLRLRPTRRVRSPTPRDELLPVPGRITQCCG
jgi:hypothetical protein